MCSIKYKEGYKYQLTERYSLLLEDGMDAVRAWYWKQAVILARGGDPDIPDDVVVKEAP